MIRLLCMGLLFRVLTQDPALWAADTRAQTLKNLCDQGDYLGARIVVKDWSKKKISPESWFQVRNEIFNCRRMGEDIIIHWDQIPPSELKADSTFSSESELRTADRLLASGHADQALQSYQKMAQLLKKRRGILIRSGDDRRDQLANLSVVYPYALHGMARALYSSGRFDEALEVYSWIRPDYPRFKQSLFEKMWSAFKAKRYDIALGSIISQRSSYFSGVLEPETYLLQIYLHRIFCQDGELERVVAEIKSLREQLTSGKMTYSDWANTEIHSMTLLKLSEDPRLLDFPRLSKNLRTKEQEAVRGDLQKGFEFWKRRIKGSLEITQAYSQLAANPAIEFPLQAQKGSLQSQELLESKMEIWAKTSSEDWIDEMGRHRYIGEIPCKKSE